MSSEFPVYLSRIAAKINLKTFIVSSAGLYSPAYFKIDLTVRGSRFPGVRLLLSKMELGF